jgi:formylglycine-generating enzyme required for sulfatase activity
MTPNDDPLAIIDRIVAGNPTEADINVVRQLLVPGNSQNVVQLGKYNVNLGQGQGDIHIGDRIYNVTDPETIKTIIREFLPEIINSIEKSLQQNTQISLPSDLSPQTSNKEVITTSNSKTQSPPITKNLKFEVVIVNTQGTRRYHKEAEYFIENLDNRVVLEMVLIPGGKFQMGASTYEEASQEDERPQHIVNIKPFFMSRYPITQAQWKIIATRAKINRNLNPDPSYFKGDNLPIERVSWHDAQEFCQRLSRETGGEYYLPSEAQWEYACRAKTGTPFHFGKTITKDLANYREKNENINSIYRQQTTEVGSFPANNFGLSDMHGLVWEWCADIEHDDYQSAPLDGSAWLNDGNEEYRVLRGGSWNSSNNLCRSAYRFSEDANTTTKEIGFRVVCSFT